MKSKIIVILGPTATGKSDLAVRLAKKFNGEIISADSRQVYKGLDLGTGKITKKEMKKVPHHLLDVVSPKKTFTVAQFKEKAEKTIEQILKKEKVPIICGGTGFYIQTLVDNLSLPEVPPNQKLREELRSKNNEELFTLLSKLDPNRAEAIDRNNPVRLIRAIEIAKALGKVPKTKTDPKYESLQIGLDVDDATLKEKIYKRIVVRIKKGMIEEVKKLHTQGLSWKRMEELGLEYRYISRFLKKEISKEDIITQLASDTWHFAKRQRTWFKRDSRISWFKNTEAKKIENLAKKFLK